MGHESIVDASRPNAGRIYDYMLGGHHNFEVDRQAADQVIKLLPFGPKAMRLQRWCLQDVAAELTERRGYRTIIDFASGLPTNDHLHHVVPEGTTVIYSDYDPVVVEYAREILAGTPNVYFFLADARRPEELLNRPEVVEILRGNHDVALIYWGISTFLSDEELAHAARVLYDWSGKGACWAFNAQLGGDPNDPQMVQVRKIYEQMGTPLYYRSLEYCLELLGAWNVDKPGFVSLLDWHGLDRGLMSEEDRRQVGAGGGGYGAYLIK